MFYKKIINVLLFFFGLILCLFDVRFLATGYDEIWNGVNIWWYGLGVAMLLGTIGISSIIISLNKKMRAPGFFFALSIISIAIIIFGFFLG